VLGMVRDFVRHQRLLAIGLLELGAQHVAASSWCSVMGAALWRGSWKKRNCELELPLCSLEEMTSIIRADGASYIFRNANRASICSLLFNALTTSSAGLHWGNGSQQQASLAGLVYRADDVCKTGLCMQGMLSFRGHEG